MDPRIVTSGTTAILTTAVSDATAWRRGDFASDESWIVRLSASAIAEIDTALRSAQQQGISIETETETVTRDGFPLPTLAKLLAEVYVRNLRATAMAAMASPAAPRRRSSAAWPSSDCRRKPSLLAPFRPPSDC